MLHYSAAIVSPDKTLVPPCTSLNPNFRPDFPKLHLKSLWQSKIKLMGVKKRTSSSMEETTNGPTEMATDSTISSSKISENLKQMEKRKARKALDKERRRLASEGKQQAESKLESTTEAPKEESESKQVKQESKEAGTSVTSTSLAQPGLHLDLFSGLSSHESSVREEAVEQLVRELRDIQRSYEESNGENEEVGNFVNWEAMKDDGMENCAPSLRYAIRRFIRGVSSSREVRKNMFNFFFIQFVQNSILPDELSSYYLA